MAERETTGDVERGQRLKSQLLPSWNGFRGRSAGGSWAKPAATGLGTSFLVGCVERGKPRLGTPGRARGGFALVLVLITLVLMSVVTLAFFSKAQLNRQISSASAANQQALLLAETAVGMFSRDLRHEIEAGSEPDPFSVDPGVRNIYRPLAVSTNLTFLGSTNQISVFPSMLPQRVVAAASAPDLLVKQTLQGADFFQNGAGLTNHPWLPPIPSRGSDVSTSAQPLKGRLVLPGSWGLPGLHATNQSLPAPDWVYVNRLGDTPTEFSPEWRNRQVSNGDYIMGRFAYNVYDVGGLIDVNVVGNTLASQENAIRGRLHQVQLTNSEDHVQAPAFGDFVQWRSPQETADTLSDPARNFLTVPMNSQALTGRRDLLAFAGRDGSPISQAATRFFHTASRSLASPAYFPDPGVMALQPENLNAAEINAPLLGARFDVERTLARGTEDSVTVPVGTPVMARKFPLPKLDLLSDPATDPSDLQYYFGLTRQADGSFRYTAASPDGRIKRPAEIAAEGREPNFFEVLQAVIVAGSLGRNAGNTYTIDHARDELRNRQVWQIGANIIDQWDSDDYPTEIQYYVPTPDAWESVYGVENLPYINTVAIIAHRPAWDAGRNRFELWSVFDVWNPHQNASIPPQGIGGFRIVPRSGQMRVTLNLTVQLGSDRPDPWPGVGDPPMLSNIVRATTQHIQQQIVPLNVNRAVSFPFDLDARQPVRVGTAGPPDAETWDGGLLLNMHPNLPPAVPPDIETLAGDPAYSDLIDDLNKRLHYTSHPLIGEPGGTFGAKACNYFRLRSTPDDKVVIDLQYQRGPGGPWVTYQSIDGFLPRGGENADPFPLAGGSDGATSVISSDQALSTVLSHTLFSVNPSNTVNDFYGWRFDSPGIPDNDHTRDGFTLMKYDPRTTRFGHNELRRAQRGRTIRQSINLPGYPANNVRRDLSSGWAMLRMSSGSASRFGSHEANSNDYIAGIHSKLRTAPYRLQPADAMQWHVASSIHFAPWGYLANLPEVSLSPDLNPSRYLDRDGLIRPADGYLGAVPTAVTSQPPESKGGIGDRPVMLNRPFRSVGELGYAFRDLPWKTLDFFTRNSGDLGLVDVFSLEEVVGASPLVAGKVNPNSAPAEVLATLLAGAATKTDGSNPLAPGEARELADAIVAERTSRGPFLHSGDLVTRVFSPDGHNVNGTYDPREHRKAEREAALRALASISCTRTWNFLMDLVVQSGRFSPNSSSAADFVVSAHKRYWVSLAVDRMTGEVISEQWEPIDED